MTTREELRQLVDALSDTAATDLLDYAHWLLEGPETLSPREMERVQQGEAQIRGGDFVSLEVLKRDLGL